MTDEARELEPPSPWLSTAMELICALCDERITAEQFRELDALVCTNPAVRELYVDLMHLQAGLYHFASAMCEMDGEPGRLGVEQSTDGGPFNLHETMVLPAVSTADRDDADDLESLALPGPVSPALPQSRGWPGTLTRRALTKGGIAAVLAGVLGLLAHALPLVGAPSADAYARPIEKPPWTVATVEVVSDPVWDPAGAARADGSFVAGESLILQRGVVQVGLRHQGRLVVEGPANICFVSDSELRLVSGRFVATFPGGGLVVRCPTGTIRDLGTEFGVAVSNDGQTEVDVFKGRVSAAMASAAGTSPATASLQAASAAGAASGGPSSTTRPAAELVLSVGQAATVSASAVTPSPQGAIPQRFVTNVRQDAVNALDVADLVSGGDGTLHRRTVGVDALSGAIGSLTPVRRRDGDHAYHRAVGFPVVDGAFIPDGRSVVDSAGDWFQFPPTTNASVNLIWTGGRLPWMDDEGQVSDAQVSTALGGVDFATADHSIICTHSNNAVTLDLNAVRRLYPGRSIVGFTCKCGNSFINGWPGSTRVNPVARAFVLVDGASRYRNDAFTNQAGAMPVDVQLSGADRFLTLAATDDGKDIDRDWILWADAQLSLSPIKP